MKTNQYLELGPDSVLISKLKFYVHTQTDKKKNFVLWDFEQWEAIQIPIEYSDSDVKDLSRAIFFLGVDSVTSVSGAFEGPLDPTNGMYWSWQSGYVNFKIEGTSSLCETRKNKFMLHLGGYCAPFNMLQEIQLDFPKNEMQDPLIIHLNIDVFLESIDLIEQNQVMSASEEAKKIANLLPLIFSLEE